MVAQHWEKIRCPLCGGDDSTCVMETRSTLFGTDATSQLQRCNCGFQMTNPQPRGDALSAFYKTPEYYTHETGEGAKARFRRCWQQLQLRGVLAHLRLTLERHSQLRRFAMRMLPDKFVLKRGQSLLDFGCGDGQMLLLAGQLGLDAWGVEPDEQATRVAISRGAKVAHSLEELPTRDAGFDRVIVRHVLEHLPEPVATLKSLAQRMSQSGLMLISVPNVRSAQARIFREHWIGYDMPRHLWHFDVETLKRLIGCAGLRCVHVQTVELSGFASLSAQRMQTAGQSSSETLPGPREIEAADEGAEIVLLAAKA